VLVYIIAKSCFFRSDPHNTIDLLLVSRALRASSIAYILLHCVSQEVRGNAFKSESKSILHTTKAKHYGCYSLGSVMYLKRMHGKWCHRTPSPYALVNNKA